MSSDPLYILIFSTCNDSINIRTTINIILTRSRIYHVKNVLTINLEKQIIGTKLLLLVVLSEVTIILGISTILKGKKDNNKV